MNRKNKIAVGILDISIEKIRSMIKGRIGKKILLYQTVGSTNTVAADLAEKAEDGTVIISDSQKKGRGRLGRSWSSPPGKNIYMSITMKPQLDTQDATLLTIMSAVSCATALRNFTGLQVAIKWPNDLMVSEKKLGGILTEMKIEQGEILYAIIGIGINVNIDINEFPEDLRKIATSLKHETGRPYSRTDIIARVLNETDTWYHVLQEYGSMPVLSEWKRLASILGKEVLITAGKETLTGVAESVDDRGMLLLRLQSGELKRISSGDLTVLRFDKKPFKN
jgi:BirA family biotin operon repressor/biotin-[acetyl-CoA-carboxylase] ligase